MFRILFIFLSISFFSFSMANDIEEQIYMSDDGEEQVITEDESSDDNFVHSKKYATVQILNKITAKIKHLDVQVNSEKSFELITIKVLSCWKSSPYDLSENKILLEIFEKKANTEEHNKIFEGWMFSSSPAISTMEHPIYDVIAINCHN